MPSVNSPSLHSTEEYKKWTELQEIQTRGHPIRRIGYYMFRLIDAPVTWFHESVVKPNWEKNKVPYYHRKLPRARPIDECRVDDEVCVREANEQFRLDKTVDFNILRILKNRFHICMDIHGHEGKYNCAMCLEDYEEAELNFFIKYGELGMKGDVVAAYMKQKHRLIWERRHPDIMAARKQAYDDHKTEVATGYVNPNFWRNTVNVRNPENRLSSVGHNVLLQPLKKPAPVEPSPLQEPNLLYDTWRLKPDPKLPVRQPREGEPPLREKKDE